MLYSYKEDLNKSGIYEIRNLNNNKSYIGSAQSFKKRWSRHASSLRHNCHKNKHLQNSYNLGIIETKGNDDFIQFSILELMPNSTRTERLKKEEH